MKYMCVKCHTVFTAPWQREYVSHCPACAPKTKPPAKAKRTTNPKRERPEKALPSIPEEVT